MPSAVDIRESAANQGHTSYWTTVPGVIFDVEPECALASHFERPRNSRDGRALNRLQVVECLFLAGHGDGAKSVDSNFE